MTRALAELSDLQKHMDHIKDIVAMQQKLREGVRRHGKPVPVAELLDEALRMNASSLHRHAIKVVKEYSSTPVITVEKHKALQILVNLMRNAKQACDAWRGTTNKSPPRVLT
jgi:signal transduction histidine kinase